MCVRVVCEGWCEKWCVRSGVGESCGVCGRCGARVEGIGIATNAHKLAH